MVLMRESRQKKRKTRKKVGEIEASGLTPLNDMLQVMRDEKVERPHEPQKSEARAWKPLAAWRRATSLACGSRPRFSCDEHGRTPALVLRPRQAATEPYPLRESQDRRSRQAGSSRLICISASNNGPRLK